MRRKLFVQSVVPTLFVPQTSVVAAPPTPLLLTAPNDFQDAAWVPFTQFCASNGQLSPTGSFDASIITAGVGGFCASRQTLPITLVSGVNYSLRGFILNNNAPVWAEVAIFDGVSEEVDWWLDSTSGAGATGTTSHTANGVIDAGFAATLVGNNYTQFDMFFHFTSTPSSANLIDIRSVDSNGGTTPTNAQSFFVWGWGAP